MALRLQSARPVGRVYCIHRVSTPRAVSVALQPRRADTQCHAVTTNQDAALRSSTLLDNLEDTRAAEHPAAYVALNPDFSFLTHAYTPSIISRMKRFWLTYLTTALIIIVLALYLISRAPNPEVRGNLNILVMGAWGNLFMFPGLLIGTLAAKTKRKSLLGFIAAALSLLLFLVGSILWWWATHRGFI